MTNRIFSFIISLGLILSVSLDSFAQVDNRNRTVETIIADGLAQLPANSRDTYEKVIDEMAATGQKGIELLAGMLKPAATNQNAPFEYAIDAIVSRVTMPENPNRQSVHDGMVKAIAACTDNTNRAFLLTQLNKICTQADFDAYTSWLNDAYLREFALAGLAHMPGVDSQIAAMINNAPKSDCSLAKLAAFRKLQGVEPTLMKWAAGGCKQAGKALAVCGSKASLPMLAKAAKAEGFTGNATDSYVKLVKKLEDAKAAKAMMSAKMPEAIRCAGLQIYMNAEPKNAVKTAVSALNDKSIQYRTTALAAAPDNAKGQLSGQVIDKFKSFTPQAKTDITVWLADNDYKVADKLIASNVKSDYKPLALASVKALAKLGGEVSLETLISLLDDAEMAQAATDALLSFNGNIKNGVVSALDSSDPKVVEQALVLASTRRLYPAYGKIADLTKSSDANIRNTALKAIAGVARPDNFADLCKRLEAAAPSDRQALQYAACEAIATLSPEDQYKTVSARMSGASDKSLYYPMLAQTAVPEAIAQLYNAYKADGNKAAFEALLSVNSPAMTDILYEIAASGSTDNDRVLNCYIDVVASGSFDPATLYYYYDRGLDLNPSDAVANRFINELSSSRTFPSAMLAAKALDKEATSFAAANTVRNIITKVPSLQQGPEVKEMLEKATAILQRHKDAGDADAGYAIDDIKGVMASMNNEGGFNTAAAGSAIDKDAENFELYFDWNGTDAATVNLRSMPLVTLEPGKGITYAGKSIAAGKGWNTVHITMVNDRINVDVNGTTLAANTVIASPAKARGAVSIDGSADAIRNVYYNRMPDTPVFVLSPEEKAQGFEVLFDGRNLDKWHGNTSAYVPVDGNIFVSAQWGGEGNLYTKDNYSDFIFRFEFYFDVPGVNNGIGIRTGRDVTGVDAAYDGMEIQILDHDDPIYQGHPYGYKGLRPYQNHGSVYGVVPSEHIEFGPIKQWHTEEIKAIGDSITVTVDGKVINKCNIREACKGHNVAPDGGSTNPYTVDHNNHPGLFNKEGYISFCGHGSGIKFRNIRVLDLSKKKGKKTRK